MNIFLKIWTWVKVNIASLLGGLQAIVKILKELLTAIVNLLSLFFPTIAAEKVVLAIRAFLELVDSWIEGLKATLIPII